MAVTPVVIIPPKYAEAAQFKQYTSTPGKAIIDKFTITNIGVAMASLSVNLVQNGGTADASNLILDARSVAPGETYTCPELVGHSLEAGGFISTIASAATTLTIRASGREIS